MMKQDQGLLNYKGELKMNRIIKKIKKADSYEGVFCIMTEDQAESRFNRDIVNELRRYYGTHEEFEVAMYRMQNLLLRELYTFAIRKN